jgi:hypothetical protein
MPRSDWPAHTTSIAPAGRPAGDGVDAEAARRDGIDGRGHARREGGRQGQHCRGGVELDALGDGGQARHQRERFEVVVPELCLAAETAQFDHRQREGESLPLGLLHDPLVQLEGGLVLGGVLGDQPAVVADRDEHAEVHAILLVDCTSRCTRPHNADEPSALHQPHLTPAAPVCCRVINGGVDSAPLRLGSQGLSSDHSGLSIAGRLAVAAPDSRDGVREIRSLSWVGWGRL